MYGFSNPAFAVLLSAGLTLAALIIHQSLTRQKPPLQPPSPTSVPAQPQTSPPGQPRRAVAWIIAVGLILILADGVPGWGSDFGGPTALIVGFAVLLFAALDRRPRLRTVVIVTAIAALATLALATVDYLRPPSTRTHLGRFVQSIVDGTAPATIARKLADNVSNIAGTPLIAMTFITAVGAIIIAWRYIKSALKTKPPTTLPLGKAWVQALGAAAIIGSIINDSSILILGTCICMGLSYALAATPTQKIQPQLSV